MSKTCSICGNTIKTFDSKLKIKNGFMCSNCGKKIGFSTTSFSAIEFAAKLTESEIKNAIQTVGDVFFNNLKQKNNIKKQNEKVIKVQNKRQIRDTRRIDQKDTLQLGQYFLKNKSILKIDNMYFDDVKQLLLINDGSLTLMNKYHLLEYKEIIDFKPIIEGKEVKKHHGIVRAVTGSIIAGPVGAVVGAVTGGKQFSEINNMTVTIYLRDNSSYSKIFISSPNKKGSRLLEQSQLSLDSLCSKLKTIIKDNDKSDNHLPDDLGDLRNLKSLLDDGIITQSDFDTKKKQLLGL